MGGQISAFEDIAREVPQGSCLEPFLFLVCINDINLSLNRSEVDMYADDFALVLDFDENVISDFCLKHRWNQISYSSMSENADYLHRW